MNSSLNLVVYAALLTWVTIMIASTIRTRGWTPQGLMLAFGNRDNLPAVTPISGRAERAAQIQWSISRYSRHWLSSLK